MSSVDLEAIRKELFEKGPNLKRWRLKRHQISGAKRYIIVEALYKAKEPLDIYQIAYIMGQSVQGTRDHVRILVHNHIVCEKLFNPANTEIHQKYYGVCPICPIKDQCDEKLSFWGKYKIEE